MQINTTKPMGAPTLTEDTVFLLEKLRTYHNNFCNFRSTKAYNTIRLITRIKSIWMREVYDFFYLFT